MTSQPDVWRPVAIDAANRHGIDPGLFARQIEVESNFDPSARSGAGAEGIAQFIPGTAAGLGVDPWNPTQALDGAARLDAENLRAFGGDYALMLAAYNAGAGAVRQYGGVPPFPETQRYVALIMPSLGAIGAAPSPTAPTAPSVPGFPSFPPVLASWANLSAGQKTLALTAAAAGAYFVLTS